MRILWSFEHYKIKFCFKTNGNVLGLQSFLNTEIQEIFRKRFYFVFFLGMILAPSGNVPYFYLWTKLHFCILPRYDLFRIDASYVKECVAALNNKNSFEAQQKSIYLISYDAAYAQWNEFQSNASRMRIYYNE